MRRWFIHHIMFHYVCWWCKGLCITLLYYIIWGGGGGSYSPHYVWLCVLYKYCFCCGEHISERELNLTHCSSYSQLLWMEPGLTGVYGVLVPGPVKEGSNPAHGSVTILIRITEVTAVVGAASRDSCVTTRDVLLVSNQLHSYTVTLR